jgi:putative ABC transport system substrate-binding protein
VLTRRNLLAGLSAWLVLLVPVDAQPRPRLLGLLSPYSRPEYERGRDVLVNALLDLGYVQGRDYVLVERLAEGANDRLPGLAAELVREKVDLIGVTTTNAALAAKQATSTIPIVFESVADPVLAGLADSIAHPGHNMTGLSNFSADLTAKRLQFLTQMVPHLARVAILANPTNPYYSTQMQRIQPAMDRLNLQPLVVDAASAAALDPAFSKMAQLRADAVLVTADGYLWTERQRIADLALRGRLPSIAAFPEYVEAGGLMSYGVDPTIGIRRVATFIDKIFKGADPGDLPIEQPSQVSLFLNRRTAAALQLSIPSELLLQAEQVIG